MTSFLGTVMSGKSRCFVDFLNQHEVIVADPEIQSSANAAEVFTTETRFLNTHTSLFLHACILHTCIMLRYAEKVIRQAAAGLCQTKCMEMQVTLNLLREAVNTSH